MRNVLELLVEVVASAIDAIVYPVAIAEDGTMSTDTTSKYIENGLVVSKKTLGDKYAMRPASPVGKEWFEQAAAFDATLIGKNADFNHLLQHLPLRGL